MAAWLPILYYVVYLATHAAAFVRLRKPVTAAAAPKFISVIAPARNEAANIEACLTALAAQTHPDFEVIVVDDASTDTTAELVVGFAKIQPDLHLRLIRLKDRPGAAHKKYALTQGIAVAEGEHIVQLDADCRPGPQWLEALNNAWAPDVGLIAGPVRLTPAKSWLEKAQALELAGLVALAGGGFGLGAPHLCNGANLAYTKAAFRAAGGFDTALSSGDDMILLERIRSRSPFRAVFLKDERAIVDTAPCRDWAALKRQRLRWVSKSRAYRAPFLKFSLAMSWLAHLSVILLLLLDPLPAGLAAFCLKSAADALCLCAGAVFLKQTRLLWLIPTVAPVYLFYVLWVGVRALTLRRYEWKGRQVQ